MLNGPHSLVVTRNGDLYVADTWNNRVRKIDARTGEITNVVGTGRKGFSGDGGPADPGGVWWDLLPGARRGRAGPLPGGPRQPPDPPRRSQIRDRHHRGGQRQKGVPADGDEAVSAPLVNPRAVAIDARGNVYILERGGHALRVVDRSGKIRTVAGDGRPGDSGDGGDARHARLNGPKHLCTDDRGNVLIADTENHRIRVYRPDDGTIQELAGTGRKGANGLGGPPAEAELSQPHGVTIGPRGIVYIADSSNNRILKIVP